MTRRRLLWLALAGLVLSAAALWQAWRERGVSNYRGKTLWFWAMQLGSPNQPERIEATNAIRSLDTNAVPDLVRLLRTKDAFLRREVWQLQPKLPSLLQQWVLKSVRPANAERVRNAAAQALGVLGHSARSAIPVLVRSALNDLPNRWTVCEALSRTGVEAVPELILLGENKDTRLRVIALKSLENCGPTAIPALPTLMKALDDPEEPVRFVAARSLAALGPAGIQVLTNALDNPDPRIRQRAIQALGCFPQARAEAMPRLLQVLTDENPTCRTQALQTLARLGAPNYQMIDAFLVTLKDPVLSVRLAALQALRPARLKRAAVVAGATACLDDEAASVRESAAILLGGLGFTAQPATARLTERLHDKEDRVRTAVQKALERIHP